MAICFMEIPMVAKKKDDLPEMEPDAMERMNRALREAMKAPPRPHKDEPKRRKKRTYKAKGKQDG